MDYTGITQENFVQFLVQRLKYAVALMQSIF